jgi:hypothetical protein
MNTLSKKEQYLYGPAIPLFNSGNWTPDLHPRNSIGEFIYTDGGLHGRSLSRHSRPNLWAAVSKTGPGSLANPNKLGDADIDAQLQAIYNLIKSRSDLGKKWGYDWQMAMEGLDTPRFAGLNNTYFSYSGTKYPLLNGLTMSGQELNYIGIGAGFAASGDSSPEMDAGIIYWKARQYKQLPTSNNFTAAQPGYNAYKATHP